MLSFRALCDGEYLDPVRDLWGGGGFRVEPAAGLGVSLLGFEEEPVLGPASTHILAPFVHWQAALAALASTPRRNRARDLTQPPGGPVVRILGPRLGKQEFGKYAETLMSLIVIFL